MAYLLTIETILQSEQGRELHEVLSVQELMRELIENGSNS